MRQQVENLRLSVTLARGPGQAQVVTPLPAVVDRFEPALCKPFGGSAGKIGVASACLDCRIAVGVDATRPLATGSDGLAPAFGGPIGRRRQRTQALDHAQGLDALRTGRTDDAGNRPTQRMT